MKEDFTTWHSLKQQLHERHDAPSFEEREIWWTCIGANVGYEQDGKHAVFHRPVLVVRKFSRHLFLGVPLSTKQKSIPYYHCLTFKGEQQCAILMQARAWSVNRLQRKMGKLHPVEFERVREALREML